MRKRFGPPGDCPPAGRRWQAWWAFTLALTQVLLWALNAWAQGWLTAQDPTSTLAAYPQLHTAGLGLFALEWVLLLALFHYWITDEINAPAWWTGALVVGIGLVLYGLLPYLVANALHVPSRLQFALLLAGVCLLQGHSEAADRLVEAGGGRANGELRVPPVPVWVSFR